MLLEGVISPTEGHSRGLSLALSLDIKAGDLSARR